MRKKTWIEKSSNLKNRSIVKAMITIFILIMLNIFQFSIWRSENISKKNLIKISSDLKNDLETEISRNRTFKHLNKIVSEKLRVFQYQSDMFRYFMPERSKLSEVVYKKAVKYNLPPHVIMRLIRIESAFDPRAISVAGAYGYMQINYSAWKNYSGKYLDFSRLFETEYNIEWGCYILKKYLDEAEGDMSRALHLYNNGYLYNNEKYKFDIMRAF